MLCFRYLFFFFKCLIFFYASYSWTVTVSFIQWLDYFSSVKLLILTLTLFRLYFILYFSLFLRKFRQNIVSWSIQKRNLAFTFLFKLLLCLSSTALILSYNMLLLNCSYFLHWNTFIFILFSSKQCVGFFTE